MDRWGFVQPGRHAPAAIDLQESIRRDGGNGGETGDLRGSAPLEKNGFYLNVHQKENTLLLRLLPALVSR